MSPTIDPALLSLLSQGGFAILFIWLLLDTRQAANKREDRLTEMLDAYAKNLPVMADTLRRIEERLGRIEEDARK